MCGARSLYLAATRLVQQSAALGTDVHDATALDDQEILDESTVDASVAPFLGAWRRFRRETGFVPTAIEERIYHPAHGFAGTLDREGTFVGPWTAPYLPCTGADALLEIKSGAICPTHALQTAAYWTTRAKKRQRRGSVYLHPDGTYSLVWYLQHAVDWSTFLAALVRYHWKQKHGI